MCRQSNKLASFESTFAVLQINFDYCNQEVESNICDSKVCGLNANYYVCKPSGYQHLGGDCVMQCLDDADFVNQNVPTTMQAGEYYPISIVMKNTGINTWTAEKFYQLGAQNPHDNIIWGQRIKLEPTEAIAPNENKTFIATVKAPTIPGIYNFQWKMVQENVKWFGKTTTNIQIRVK